MSSGRHAARLLEILLNDSRKREEEALKTTPFVGKVAKGYKYTILSVSIVGIGLGLFLMSIDTESPYVGMLFGIIGVLALLMLPCVFSYQCYVDQNTIKLKYYILFFKISKEVPWNAVKYKRVKRDSSGHALSMVLYNSDKKKLASFDNMIVGFGKIVRMAKRISTLNR